MTCGWKKCSLLTTIGNDLTQLATDNSYWIKIGGDHTWEVSDKKNKIMAGKIEGSFTNHRHPDLPDGRLI